MLQKLLCLLKMFLVRFINFITYYHFICNTKYILDIVNIRIHTILIII